LSGKILVFNPNMETWKKLILFIPVQSLRQRFNVFLEQEKSKEIIDYDIIANAFFDIYIESLEILKTFRMRKKEEYGEKWANTIEEDIEGISGV
jgi:hypothetical protein